MVYGTLEDFVPSNDAEDSWRKKVVKQGHPFKGQKTRKKRRKTKRETRTPI
jgi:hypothetical protein